MPKEEAAYSKYVPIAQAVYRSHAQTCATSTVMTVNFSNHAINPTLERGSTSADQLNNW